MCIETKYEGMHGAKNKYQIQESGYFWVEEGVGDWRAAYRSSFIFKLVCGHMGIHCVVFICFGTFK